MQFSTHHPLSILIWWYPLFKSISEKMQDPCNSSNMSSSLGIGCLYFTVMLLMALRWTHILHVPSFLGTSSTGTAQGLWCKPRDHVVTQLTTNNEIWSRKAEIGLIGVWHNGNLPQGTSTIGRSRMTPRSQLIFDKSDSVRSRTEECKNHSHT